MAGRLAVSLFQDLLCEDRGLFSHLKKIFNSKAKKIPFILSIVSFIREAA